MNIGKIVKDYRQKNKISMSEMAKRCKVSKAYIGFLEAGVNPSTGKPIIPGIRTVNSIATGMGMTLDDLIALMGDDEISLRDLTDDASDSSVYESAGLQYISVPLYNPICCGNGLFTEDEIINYVAVPADGLSRGLEYFAQVAKGDSMNGIGIEDGDLLVFQKTSSVDPGSIVCVCIEDNEAMCKKYTVQNNMIVLLPANPAYDPIIVDPMSAEFHIVGLLKKSIKSF